MNQTSSSEREDPSKHPGLEQLAVRSSDCSQSTLVCSAFPTSLYPPLAWTPEWPGSCWSDVALLQRAGARCQRFSSNLSDLLFWTVSTWLNFFAIRIITNLRSRDLVGLRAYIQISTALESRGGVGRSHSSPGGVCKTLISCGREDATTLRSSVLVSLTPLRARLQV